MKSDAGCCDRGVRAANTRYGQTVTSPVANTYTIVPASQPARDLSSGLVGIVAAFALPEVAEAKDRWGSANNLAKADGPGRGITERYLRENLDLDQLPPIEAALIRSMTHS